MGRQWREEYQDGIYHVIARGNNKEYIFKEIGEDIGMTDSAVRNLLSRNK